jgi:glycosyltransferase involved in cell wall biosynthesis
MSAPAANGAATPIAIIDPALGRTGAHNQGFVDLLVRQGVDANRLGIWCHASIDQPLRDRLTDGGIAVQSPFSTEFYQIIGRAGGIADHWEWVRALAEQYLQAMTQVLATWPLDAIRVIHHTMSWEHASALSLAMRLLGARGDRLHHLVFLMYSPGIDEAGSTFDADRRLNYRLAFHPLDTLPNLRLYASCGEYAHAYAALLGRSAPLPVHPCFIGDWRSPPRRKAEAVRGHERVLLYVGEIKQEKGFLSLPDTLRSLLESSPPTRRFVVQFLNVRNDASRKVLNALELIAANHANVELHHGFWSDERLHEELAACDVLHLDYDAVAYAHKTSGLLWLAAWYGMPVLVPSNGWLQREARRLGLGILADISAEPGDVRTDKSAIDEAYRRTLFTPFWQWLEQRDPSRARRARADGHLAERASNKVGAIDVVVFWKQNDSTLYGRRIDMIVRYLASRADIRRVIVIDAPIGDRNLAMLGAERKATHHGRMVHARTLKKQAGAFDSDKIAYKVFVCPLKEYRFREDGSVRPRFIEGYVEFLQDVFSKERIDPRRAVFWFYPRNLHASALLRKFEPAKVVVDVVDDDRAWPGVQEDTRRELTDNLQELLQAADMAFANCLPVQQSMREFYPDIRLVPNGCDLDPPRVLPQDEAFRSFVRRSGKVIGFVGNLEAKIDIALLHKVAERFHDCHIVLIGSTHSNPEVLELSRHSNVSLPGPVPYEDLGAWLDRFDVGLIPHLNMDLTRYMNPLKAYVYLSRHIPVVATAVPNIGAAPGLLRVAHTHAAFLHEVATVLAGNRPSPKEFKDYAAKNSWKARFASHIDELGLDRTRGE